MGNVGPLFVWVVLFFMLVHTHNSPVSGGELQPFTPSQIGGRKSGWKKSLTANDLTPGVLENFYSLDYNPAGPNTSHDPKHKPKPKPSTSTRIGTSAPADASSHSNPSTIPTSPTPSNSPPSL